MLTQTFRGPRQELHDLQNNSPGQHSKCCPGSWYKTIQINVSAHCPPFFEKPHRHARSRMAGRLNAKDDGELEDILLSNFGSVRHCK